MRNLKKLIALFAAVSVLCTGMAFAAESFTDVEAGTATYEAVSTLNALNIITGYPDGSFGPEKTITRAEFSAVICRSIGLDGVIAQTNTSFSDVDASHWASGYIAMTEQLGIVNGMPDGTFEPDSPVTYAQSLKMITVALGYEPMAASNNGWPTGYVVAASSSGVTKGIGTDGLDEPASRGLVARLLYNAVDTPLMEVITWGAVPEFRVHDGNNGTSRTTLLSSKLDVYKLRGVVVANSSAYIVGGTTNVSAGRDRTVVVNITDDYKMNSRRYPINANLITTTEPYPTQNRFSFRVGGSDIEKWLGRSVVLFAREESGMSEDVVISVAPESSINETTVISIDLFEKIERVSTNDIRITYKKDVDDRNFSTEAVVANPSVIYNGRTDTLDNIFGLGEDENVPTGAGILNERNGTITLVNSQSSSSLNNVIFVESPHIAVVDSISENSNQIFLKNSVAGMSSIDLDKTSRPELVYKLTKAGKDIELADVKAWDVLSIVFNEFANEDDYIEIRVNSNAIEGTVSGKAASDTSGAGVAFEVNNTWYDVAFGSDVTSALSVGTFGTFFIDEYGKIAAFRRTSQSGSQHYGFVMNIRDNNAGFDDELEVRLLEQDGVLRVRNFASNIILVNTDAPLGASMNLKNNAAHRTAVIEALEDKAVRYEINNSTGAITKIETGLTTSQAEEYAFTRFNNSTAVDKKSTYNASMKRFSGGDGRGTAAFIDENTILMFVNGEPGNWDRTNSSLRSMDSLVDDQDYNIEAFDVDDMSTNSAARFVVVYNAQAVALTDSLAILDGISSTVNEERDSVYNLNVLMDGERKVIRTTPEANAEAAQLTSLKNGGQGAGLQLGFNAKGEADSIKVLFDIARLSGGNIPSGLKGPVWEAFSDPLETLGDAPIVLATTDGGEDLATAILEADFDDDIKLYVGTGHRTQNNRVNIGATRSARNGDDPAEDAGAIYIDSVEAFAVASDANIYKYDIAFNGSNRLVSTQLANILNAPNNWANDNVNSFLVSNASDFGLASGTQFDKPVIEARDLVIIKTVEDIVEDVLIVKAPNYRI